MGGNENTAVVREKVQIRGEFSETWFFGDHGRRDQ
jgi:hypothetical protein